MVQAKRLALTPQCITNRKESNHIQIPCRDNQTSKQQMPHPINTICIYCASSPEIDSCYLQAAEELGEKLAKKNITCVCGAGNSGLMGVLCEKVLLGGGRIIGVIPRFMYENGWYHPQLQEIEITQTMHERKSRMAQLSDVYIALPGGCGTMEELLEIITWKQLGLCSSPIVILNINGYYNALIEMLHTAIDQRFMKPDQRHLWSVATTVDQALQQIGI